MQDFAGKWESILTNAKLEGNNVVLALNCLDLTDCRLYSFHFEIMLYLQLLINLSKRLLREEQK